MNALIPTLFALLAVALVIGAGLFGVLVAVARTVEWDRRDAVLLGVCRRMAQRLGVPVRGVRILTATATVFTGIIPGLVGYVAAAAILGRRREPAKKPAPSPQLLGLCADLARRLDVPVDNVRFLVVVGTLTTGLVPGVLLYFLAGILKAIVPPATAGAWFEGAGVWFEGTAAGDPDEWSPAPASPERAAMPARIGRYRILGLLGRGGMGSVWRGRDDALGRDAAVKVVDGPFGGDAVRRFGEEARAAAALASPHIVQIWEYAPDARPPFLAMEYVPGRSVLQLVRSGGPQSIATALDCARQVLAGLAAAHAAGIVHRDIKPANILLATSGPSAGTYKLTDFGLAFSADREHSLTATGTLLGTLSYLAPEVALGDDATPSSDLYSLGATLHEMLVGRPPLTAESPLKLLRRITSESIPPITTLRPDLPADLAAWLERMVARDPAARFRSAEEALTALAGVDGAAQATTDLERARTARIHDAVPWHRRPAPGSSPPRSTLRDRDLPDVLGRAMAFEADGRDALGEDSILDIARELDVDPAAVREALLRRREGGGEGVTQIFRRALGGEGRGTRGVSLADDAVVPASWRRTWSRGIALTIALLGAALVPLLIAALRDRQSAGHAPHRGDAVESIGESFSIGVSAPWEAETTAPADVPPAPSPPHPSRAPRGAPANDGAATTTRTPWPSGTLLSTIALCGAAVVALPRNRRRRLA